jgi:hypothetical protein
MLVQTLDFLTLYFYFHFVFRLICWNLYKIYFLFLYQGTLKDCQLVHSEEPACCYNACHENCVMLSKLTCHKCLFGMESLHTHDVYNKSFSSKWNLKKHQQIYSGENPYHCNTCNKSFSNKWSLKRHQLTHSRELPYHSAVSNKLFSCKSYLKTHQHLLSGERPCFCNVCNRTIIGKWRWKYISEPIVGSAYIAVTCVVIHSVIRLFWQNISGYIDGSTHFPMTCVKIFHWQEGSYSTFLHAQWGAPLYLWYV